ncbi:MAG TPA: hypothetical protein VJV79_10160, partial [Polyangiaceae bacterium]|nr:hypothetical protein [Polyangiaceae bacterium]
AGGAGAGGAAGKPSAGEAPDIEGGSGGSPFGTAGVVDIGVAGGGTSGAATEGGGGTVIPLSPGEIGQACIPGDLITEADGSPAKTQIQTLARCNEGLACNAQNKCVPAPDCPSSGLCVMRRAALAGNGGVGGAPGSVSPAAAGSSGAPWSGVGGVPSGGADNNNGPLRYATDKSGVVALTANESRVYWVEYGTRDPLGNYQHDGALLAYTIADGTTTVLASGLEGPTKVELTTSHAYVYVDGAPLLGALTAPQLLRVPLAGGSVELVQNGAQPWSFASVGSRALWNSGGNTVYSILSDSNVTPTVFASAAVSCLAADATDLYYAASDEQLVRSPLTGAPPVGLNLYATDFMLYDDGIFGTERLGAGAMMVRAPKGGGPFVRVRALGDGYPGRLQVVANRYFLDVESLQFRAPNGWETKRQVLSAGFADSDPPIRVLERRNRNNLVDQLWVGTANALYWSEGQAIYQQPLPTP